MEIRIEFTLEPDEVRGAIRRSWRRKLRRLAVVQWLLVCFLLACVLALIAITTNFSVPLGLPALVLAVACILALPLSLMVMPKRVGREIAPSFLEKTTALFSEQQLTITRETFAGSGTWKHFAAWRELPEFVVLEHSASTLLILPKRAIDVDTLLRLRELLTKKLGQATPA